jgi:hypothetical protein
VKQLIFLFIIFSLTEIQEPTQVLLFLQKALANLKFEIFVQFNVEWFNQCSVRQITYTWCSSEFKRNSNSVTSCLWLQMFWCKILIWEFLFLLNLSYFSNITFFEGMSPSHKKIVSSCSRLLHFSALPSRYVSVALGRSVFLVVYRVLFLLRQGYEEGLACRIKIFYLIDNFFWPLALFTHCLGSVHVSYNILFGSHY